MEKNKLKGIIFDLDGVITNSAKYHYLAWKALADELNIFFDEAYNEKLKGVSRMESLELILDNANSRKVYSQEEKEKMATQKNEHYQQLIRQMGPQDILPGIKSLLEEAKNASLHIGLASVSKNAPFIIQQLGLESYFEFVADPQIVKRAKPYPDLFLAGLDYFQISPLECVGVEDAKAGIEAIHRAKMKAIGVGTISEMKEADVIAETKDLTLSFIKEHLGFE